MCVFSFRRVVSGRGTAAAGEGEAGEGERGPCLDESGVVVLKLGAPALAHGLEAEDLLDGFVQRAPALRVGGARSEGCFCDRGARGRPFVGWGG